jgi:hypothetical protein
MNLETFFDETHTQKACQLPFSSFDNLIYPMPFVMTTRLGGQHLTQLRCIPEIAIGSTAATCQATFFTCSKFYAY